MQSSAPLFAVLLGTALLGPVFVSVQGIVLFGKMALVICRRVKSKSFRFLSVPDC